MRLQLASPKVQDGDFTVYVNGSGMKNGGAGFAVIQLDEYGDTDLTFSTPEEIDQLITAACAAKRMLLAARVPHSYRPDSRTDYPYSHKCGECGVSKGHHLAPEPVLEGTVTGKPADAPYAPTLHEQRLQAVRENSPAVQDGPCAYLGRDQ